MLGKKFLTSSFLASALLAQSASANDTNSVPPVTGVYIDSQRAWTMPHNSMTDCIDMAVAMYSKIKNKPFFDFVRCAKNSSPPEVIDLIITDGQLAIDGNTTSYRNLAIK